MRRTAILLVASLVALAGIGAATPAVADAAQPDAPRISQVDPADGGAWVRFGVATDAGGFYTMTASPGGQSCSAPSGTWVCEVTGLTNGETYTFTGTQTAQGATSAQSAASDPVVPRDDVTAPVIASRIITPTRLPASGGEVTATLHITDDRSGVDASTFRIRFLAASYSLDTPASLTSGDLNDGVWQGTVTIPAGAPNTWYFQVLQLQDVEGNATWVAAETPGPVVGVPDPPTDVRAAISGSTLHLSWTPPLDDGGSAITDYALYDTRGDLMFTTPDATPSIDIPAEGVGGVAWRYSVQTVTDVGRSTELSVLSPAAPSGAGVPTPPTTVLAQAGIRSATISYSGMQDSGSAMTATHVVLEPGDKHCDASWSPCEVDGLTPGTTYTVSVSGVNGVGEGPASNPVTVTPYGPPEAPLGVTAVAGPGAVRVSWNAPASDNGSAITGYRAWAYAGGNLYPDGTCETTTRSCVITNLPLGVQESITVVATNAASWGPKSTAVSATTHTTPWGPCPGRASVDFRASTVHLSWACADDVFGKTTEYLVEITAASGKKRDYATTAPQLQVTGLPDDTSYSVQVSPLTGDFGPGYYTATHFRIPDLQTRPGRMGAPTAGSIHSTSVVTKWAGASVGGGTPVARYDVRLLRGTTTVRTATTSSTVRSLTWGSLRRHVRYSVEIRATNFAGAGSWSTARTFTTLR